MVAQWKQNDRHSAKISMQFIAFIIKNARQASLAEIVNFCNIFPCAGFFIVAYPMTMAESKMCENIGLTAYI